LVKKILGETVGTDTEKKGFAEKTGLANLKVTAESADDFTKQGFAD
jgi:hypothetical protein